MAQPDVRAASEFCGKGVVAEGSLRKHVNSAEQHVTPGPDEPLARHDDSDPGSIQNRFRHRAARALPSPTRTNAAFHTDVRRNEVRKIGVRSKRVGVELRGAESQIAKAQPQKNLAAFRIVATGRGPRIGQGRGGCFTTQIQFDRRNRPSVVDLLRANCSRRKDQQSHQQRTQFCCFHHALRETPGPEMSFAAFHVAYAGDFLYLMGFFRSRNVRRVTRA
jgi:hypothetical protein